MCAKRYEFYDPKLSEEYAQTGEGFFQKYFGCSQHSLLGYLKRINIAATSVFSRKHLLNSFRLRGVCTVDGKISPRMFEREIILQAEKLATERERLLEENAQLKDLLSNTVDNEELVYLRKFVNDLPVDVLRAPKYHQEFRDYLEADAELLTEEELLTVNLNSFNGFLRSYSQRVIYELE